MAPASIGARRRGLSVLEVLVALALVAVAAAMSASLVAQEPRTLERLEAHREALAAIDMTLDAVRAGRLPLADGDLDPVALGFPNSVVQLRLQLRLEISPEVPAGLSRVRASARYAVQGRLFERQVETLIFTP